MARYDTGTTVSGAATGAAAGGAIGGPLGAGIGAGVGAVAGFFGSRKKKRHKKTGGAKIIDTLDPAQKELHAQQIAAIHGKGPLKDLYKFDKKNPFYKYNPKEDRFRSSPFHKFDERQFRFNPNQEPYRFNPNQEPYQFNPNQEPYQFDPNSPFYNFNAEAANRNFETNVARPAYRSFSENIVPEITGQFRKGNLGTSTYAGEALARRGRDIQETLDAARANMIYQGEQQAEARKYQAFLTSGERKYEGLLNAENRRYEGFKNAEERRYEGFKTADQRRYQGYQTADQRKYADYITAQNRQYAGRQLANERAYTDYSNANVNRRNTLNDLINRETFTLSAPNERRSSVEQTFNKTAPAAFDYLLNEFGKAGPSPKQVQVSSTNQLNT